MARLFGAGKSGGDSPSEAPDNKNSRAYLRMVEILSEGEIEGFATPSKLGLVKGTTEYSNALMKDVYYNKTRLLKAQADNSSPDDGDFNFRNVSLWPRYGTQNQTFVDNGFDAIEDEYSVNIEVKKDEPITRTITDENVDAVRVTINFPQLQKVQDDGDVKGTSVRLQIQVQYDGAGYGVAIDDTVNGRSADLYQKDYLIFLTNVFPVDIRVVRLTDDSTTVRKEDKFLWFSYTEITYQKLTYPNTALIATRLDAEQFSSIPQRSYRIRGIKVKIPTNCTVNPDNGRLIYSGIWDGQLAAAQWTTCPAWILYDLLTSTRYGCGDFIKPEMLDKWAFYQASLYSNELVPTGLTCPECEPRFSCNVNIQSETEVYKLITDLASVFRAMTYWSAGSIAIAQDRPQESTALFTLANVEEGGFTYETSSLKSRATVVAVSWLNLETQDVDVELVEDRDAILKYGVNKKEINAFATTSRSQARRIGEWVLYTDNKETEVVSFRVGMEHGSVLRPGAVVEIADLMKAGVRKAGRISSATTTAITVDSPTGLGGDTTLAVSLPDGRVEVRSISSIVGSVITVSPGFSVAPQNGATWMTGLPLLGRTEECDPCTNEEPCGSTPIFSPGAFACPSGGALPSCSKGQLYGTWSPTGVNEYGGVVILKSYSSGGGPQYDEYFVAAQGVAGGITGFRANYTGYVGGYGNGHTAVTIEACTATGHIPIFTLSDPTSRQYQWALNLRLRSTEPNAVAITSAWCVDQECDTIYENPGFGSLPAPAGFTDEQNCPIGGSVSPAGATTVTWDGQWMSHSDWGLIFAGSCAKVLRTGANSSGTATLTGGVSAVRISWNRPHPWHCEGGGNLTSYARFEYLRTSTGTWQPFGPSAAGGAFTYAAKGVYQYIGSMRFSTTEGDAVSLGPLQYNNPPWPL